MAESQNIEWKESWRDEYLKWICGFANAQGGKIYIGTNDDGTVVGVKDSKKLLEDIPNKVRDILGILVDVNLLTENGKDYIEICISPNTYPVNYRGEYHYRSGSTRQLLKGQALNQFLLKKTGITWDSISVQNISAQELRNDSFDIFREQAVKSGRMDEPDIQVSNEQLLDHLNLIHDGLLTRAAVLLFHHNPEKWIPGSYVKIAYFQSESDILYQDEVHGSLLSQADRVVDLIYTKYLKGIISYQNITRVETYPYPKEAIREAVLNAISHKNYATLVPIQIRVYDNKIIIANDCVFPEDWTVDDLMGPHKSRPYNPLIANTFFRAGFIEAWGRGIQKIKDSCVLAGNDIPEYYVKKEDIMVLFRGLGETTPQSPQTTPQSPQRTLQLDEIDSRIIKVIESKPSISQRKIATLIGVSYDTVRYHMEDMKKREIIVRKGNGRSGKWISRINGLRKEKSKMIKILFICHGNICRSPMAEFVLKDMVQKAGLSDRFEIASAATSTEEIGNPVHRGTREKLRQVGISTAGKTAVQLKKSDYGKYDYLIGMDTWNIRNMQRMLGGDPEGKIYKLLSFADSDRDVADPWYTGDFEATYRDVVAGCSGLLRYLGLETIRE